MRLLSAVCVLLLCVSCTSVKKAPAPLAGKQPSAPAVAPSAEPGLEVMVGQMILAGFRGTGEKPLSQDITFLLEDIKAGRVGGVIYFDRDVLSKTAGRNVKSAAQVKALSALLQKDASIPLFVSIDQEGGRVQRLRQEHGFFDTPSAKEMGKGTVAQTRAFAEGLGRGLRSLGINLDFAPSLDVDVNPQSPAIGAVERSFSPDPQKVAAHGLAFAQGLYATGVIPCYKHFPGHGSAANDTHLGLTDITKSFKQYELAPYRTILPQSPPAMVMPAHIIHKGMGRGLPSSLSPAIITSLLRKKLGWKGVVVSDDLQMQAIEGYYSTKEALRMCVTAGADILLLGNNLRHDPQQARKAHALLLELVREGALTKERIKASYDRIIALKKAAGIVR
ncbi:glycoside hydrolase family 3 [Desulfovibrio sp. OttesenSCG-928-G15]|nr:glycoside hydrolase family 3 [Desulfovibrio sp. OttesenSCG-928-G15]